MIRKKKRDTYIKKDYGFTCHQRLIQEDEVSYLFLAANHVFLSFIGLDEEDVLGKTLSSLPEDLTLHLQRVYERLQQRGESLLSYYLSSSIGCSFKINASFYGDGYYVTLFEKYPLRDQNSSISPLSFLKIDHDIQPKTVIETLYQLTGVHMVLLHREGTTIVRTCQDVDPYQKNHPQRKSYPLETDSQHIQASQSVVYPFDGSSWIFTVPFFKDGEYVGDLYIGPWMFIEKREVGREGEPSLQPSHTRGQIPTFNQNQLHEVILLYLQLIQGILEHDCTVKQPEERKDYLSMTLDSLAKGIILLDERGEILYMNREASRLTSWRREEIGGDPIKDIIPLGSHLLEEIKKSPLKVQKTIRTRERGEVPILYTLTPLYDDREVFKGVVVTFSSHHHQPMIERDVEEDKEEFSTLISHVPGILYQCKMDKDWTMEFISDGIEDLTGYSPDLFLKRYISFNSMIHPQDREDVRERVHEAIAQKKPFTTIYRLVNREGTIRWVQGKGQGLYHQEKLEAIHGFIIDIHEQKEIEEALKESEEKYRLMLPLVFSTSIYRVPLQLVMTSL